MFLNTYVAEWMTDERRNKFIEPSGQGVTMQGKTVETMVDLARFDQNRLKNGPFLEDMGREIPSNELSACLSVELATQKSKNQSPTRPNIKCSFVDVKLPKMADFYENRPENDLI